MVGTSGRAGNVVLVVLSFSLSIGAVEVLGRVIDFDFDRQLLGLAKTPIFYLRPRVPLEPVYFRRSGPAEWIGQVLYTQSLRELGEGAEIYADEPAITVSYDAEGFRNATDLDDWEVAVVGDSFTELGYLRDEDLFTSVAGRVLGVRVKNLGVSGSAAFSQAAYLKHYGVAPSTSDAVLVFFEGNDLKDLVREHEALERFERTGDREYREIRNQSSFVKALFSIVKRRRKSRRAYGRAEIEIAGERRPITVTYAPPSSAELSELEVELIDRSIEAWSATARERGVRPWVAYMPCKIRVLYEHLSFTAMAKEEVSSWRPNDLPEHVRRVAQRHGAGFIDLTPALRRATAQGELAFNPIWDTHLTARGSRAVGRALAEALDRSHPRSAAELNPR